jgi:hypothetical protein
MRVEHGCSFKTLKVPAGVSRVIEVKRCDVCGQWWKRTNHYNGSYSMYRIMSPWPNVKLIIYRWKVRKLLG